MNSYFHELDLTWPWFWTWVCAKQFNWWWFGLRKN